MKRISPSHSRFWFQNCTKTKTFDPHLRYLSANCGSRPNCGPFNTFHWAAQHFLCCGCVG